MSNNLYVIIGVASDGTIEAYEIPPEGATELQRMIGKRRPEERSSMLVPLVLDQCTRLIVDNCYFFEIYRSAVFLMFLEMLKWAKSYNNVFFPNNLFFKHLKRFVDERICAKCRCKICPMSPSYQEYALPEDVPHEFI